VYLQLVRGCSKVILSTRPGTHLLEDVGNTKDVARVLKLRNARFYCEMSNIRSVKKHIEGAIL
jgi:hypothetical protein